MHFDQIDAEKWSSLKPYLDTCVFPVSGIHVSADQVEDIKARLNKLNEMKRWMEQMYTGRIVIYPEIHYAFERNEEFIFSLEDKMRLQGFRYVVIVSPFNLEIHDTEHLLILTANGDPFSDKHKRHFQERITQLWQTARSKNPWNME